MNFQINAHNIISNINQKLKLRFIFFVTLLVCIIMSSVVIFSINRERTVIVENVIQKSLIATKIIAKLCSELSVREINKIEDLCKLMLQDSDLLSIVIIKYGGFFESRKHEVILSYPENKNYKIKNVFFKIPSTNELFQIRYYFDLGDSFNIYLPFRFKDEVIGQILVETSLSSTQKALNLMIWQNFIITLFFTCFGGLLSIFLAQLVLKPINTIINLAKNFFDGNYAKHNIPNIESDILPITSFFNNMFQSLEQKSEYEQKLKNMERLALVGQMAAGIAHEIKNPLTSIRSLLEILKDDENLKNDNIQKNILIILNEVDRINKITNEFVMLAKPFKKEKQITDIDVNDIINKVLMLLNSQIKKNNIIVYTNLNSKTLVKANPDELAQVFLNILINSIQALENNNNEKKIIISTFDVQNRCQVEISDNGYGIDPSDINRIFMPFVTNKTNGTGLGLAIVKQILDNISASITVESNKGNLTTFKILF